MILLEYGADPLLKDDSGQSAIDVGKIHSTDSYIIVSYILNHCMKKL